MRFEKEILKAIEGAKDALDAGHLKICYDYTRLARDWLDLEIEYQELEENKPLDDATAEILSIFDHPMFTEKQAE